MRSFICRSFPSLARRMPSSSSSRKRRCSTSNQRWSLFLLSFKAIAPFEFLAYLAIFFFLSNAFFLILFLRRRSRAPRRRCDSNSVCLIGNSASNACYCSSNFFAISEKESELGCDPKSSPKSKSSAKEAEEGLERLI